MSKYDYVHTDFPNNVFNEDALKREIAADSIITATLSRISSSEDLDTGVTTVSFYFAVDLSVDEQAALDAVVAAHTGEPEVGVQAVALVTTSGDPLPISQDGGVRFAPTFEDTNDLQPQWVGHLYKATAGATSIYDEVVDVEKRIRGGWYEIFGGAVLGDYVEFSVVDKDDVLGYFTPLGLVVGQDVLELQKYVRKEYVNPGAGGRNNFMANSVWPLIPGLYMRTTFVSIGDEDVDLKVVTFAYQ
jgi:hypothetical protein